MYSPLSSHAQNEATLKIIVYQLGYLLDKYDLICNVQFNKEKTKFIATTFDPERNYSLPKYEFSLDSSAYDIFQVIKSKNPEFFL